MVEETLKKRVLIVDDHKYIRKLIRVTLEHEPYELLECATGLEAWERIREAAPDLIILDVMMPGEIDGFALCEQVKRDPALRRISVVMVTARGEPADRKRGEEAGADAYLGKPFSPLELLETAARLLRMKAQANVAKGVAPSQ